MSQAIYLTPTSGPGSGTVTSISAANAAITLTPNPITTTGTIGLTETDLTTTDGTVYWTGTLLATTATGTSGYVLTSNGASAPTYQAVSASGAVITLTGNSGGAISPSSGNINVVGDGVTVNVSGSGSTLTISSTGTTTLNYTNVNHAASPYTVLSTDEYLSVDCSGGVVTLKFPNAATLGRSYVVKDRTGNAQTNNITLESVSGSVNFDGTTTYVMNTQYSSVELMGNGTSFEIY